MNWQLPTWVPLSPADPMAGLANTDNVETPDRDEPGEYLRALLAEFMQQAGAALAVALAL